MPCCRLSRAPALFVISSDAQVLASLDLTGCSTALLIDRADNESAGARQLRLDNRKPAAQRALEGPTRTAMLMMLRGVRSVAITNISSTTWANGQLLTAVLRGLTNEGKTLGAAVGAALQGLGSYELQVVREAGMVVWGLPHAVAAEAAEGGKRGVKGAGLKK